MDIKREDNSQFPIIYIIEDANNKPDSKLDKGNFYYGWVTLIICLVLITFSYGIRFSLGIFFKSLEQDLSLTRTQTSGIFSLYMVFCALFAIIAGRIADRYGPKAVVFAMGIFAFLGLALTSQANSIWHLLLSYSLLVAMGTGPMYVIVTSEAIRWFISRRGLALAIVLSGISLGLLWIAPVAAQFIESFGWRLSFLFIGLIALITIVPASFFLRRAPTDSIILSEDKNNRTCDIDALDKQQREAKDFSLRQAIKTRNFWLLMCIFLLHSFCLFTITTHIVPYAIDSSISTVEAAPILSIFGFISLPSRILLGILTDRVGIIPIALMSAFLMMTAIVLLMQSSGLWMLYMFAIIFGVAYGGLSISSTTMVSASFGTGHIGSIMGLLEVSWVLGAAVGPALAGYIFDTTRKYFFAFLLVAIAATILAILILFINTPKTKKGMSSTCSSSK